MDVIELERWKPSETNPHKLEYVGQPMAQEVFRELEHRLENMGCLPDEYFLLDSDWQNGRKIPRDADIFCTTDYGDSEGIYLDVYLKWYEDGKPITKSFITGKTLCESGTDLDRMFLTASAITKVFHGDRATHSRCMEIGGVENNTGGAVVHLSQQEKKIIISALVEQRERQEEAMSQTEQLLRRVTGSITEYINTVGMRPLRLSVYDKAVLAIRDGELKTFVELYPKVLETHADSLLIEAAGRPGSVGRGMTLLLLTDVKRFSEPAYRAACQKAIDIDDPVKESLLLKEAESHMPGLPLSFYGEMASYAHTDHRFISAEIIRQCDEKQIAAAPPRLLEQFVMDNDWHVVFVLVEQGISGGPNAWRALHMLTYTKQNCRIAEELLQKRMWVDTGDYSALRACIKNDAANVAKLLLDGGMDFDKYRQWAEAQSYTGHEETLQALADHWSKLQKEQKQTTSQEGGK